jgi:hypothetical protein
MSSPDESTPPAEQLGPPKLTAAMKMNIRQAIALHVREHGDCDWDLVRERPEFAPFIGKESGETGRKRLLRWKQELSRRVPQDRTKPHEARELNEAHRAWAAETAQAVAASGDLAYPPTELQVREQGVEAVKLAKLLTVRLQQNSDDIERMWWAAVSSDPDGVRGYSADDPKLLAKVVQARQQQMGLELAVLREANRIHESADYADAVLDLVASTLADQPGLRDQLLEGLSNIQLRLGVVARAI